MAITHAGYDGTVDEVYWSKMADLVGSPYAVADAASFKPTAVSGVDRTVSIAAGTAYGRGVLCILTPAQTVQLPTLASGTRWDLIVLRRTWTGTGGTSVITYVSGTSVKQIPAGRLSTPGTSDDQPIALVQITAGTQVPTSIVDLRTWPSKVIRANDLLALPSPTLGTEAYVAGARYRQELDGSGNPAWVSDRLTHAGWYWGGPAGYGPWYIPNGSWTFAPGSNRVVQVVAGHLYRYSSNFTVIQRQGVYNAQWRVSQWVNAHMVGEHYGITSSTVPNASGLNNYPSNVTQHYQADVTGPVTIKTDFACSVNGGAGVHNPWRSPYTEFTDLGAYNLSSGG